MKTNFIVISIALSAFAQAEPVPAQPKGDEPIKAYDIDFNWGPGGPNAFPKPGLWAEADPAAHVAWYKSIGCNVIQSFCVSCNGYAWYKNGVVPEQPGLKHDFLPEMVKLAHQENMLVFGYFCAGANTRWGQTQPALSYGFPSEPHIPYTDEYLAYLDAAIRDAVKKTGMDGFMLDWLRMPTSRASNGNRWLDCEKKLYAQLMAEPFPGEEKITPAQMTAYGRKAVNRAWQTIRKAAKETNPACLVWLTCCDVNDPHIADSNALKETDWLLNEAGDLKRTADAKRMIGPQTRLVTCLAAWNKQDPATIVPDAQKNHTGLYGFTKPTVGNLKPPASFYLQQPVTSFSGDDRNIACLARAYLGLPQDHVEAATPPDDHKLGLTTGGSGAWQFYPAANRDPALPRVLLIGDSICNGYRGVVSRELAGKATVDVWLTPAAENDPGLHGDLEKVLKQGPYAVVHFNIGLHGWPKGRIPEGQYEPLMRKYVEVLRKHAPAAKLIWASSTPITVKDQPAELDPTDNPTITTRNASAARIMQESGVTVNDLYGLVVEQRAQLARGDRFHWKAPAYELMGKQIADRITKLLPVK
jgi:hypothetical protein